jgi:hypothetical protein
MPSRSATDSRARTADVSSHPADARQGDAGLERADPDGVPATP